MTKTFSLALLYTDSMLSIFKCYCLTNSLLWLPFRNHSFFFRRRRDGINREGNLSVAVRQDVLSNYRRKCTAKYSIVHKNKCDVRHSVVTIPARSTLRLFFSMDGVQRLKTAGAALHRIIACFLRINTNRTCYHYITPTKYNNNSQQQYDGQQRTTATTSFTNGRQRRLYCPTTHGRRFGVRQNVARLAIRSKCLFDQVCYDNWC